MRAEWVSILSLFFIFGALITMVFFSTKTIRLMKGLGKVCIRILVGALIIFVINSIGTIVDFYLPINPITALVVGILGLPGLISLILIKLYII